ncbi:MAG TPA: cupin domain-containing protein, partial [Methylomirabilota bacterium]|nr:cupin domain-containing protein [Methylomirabilota bacterium]
TSMRTALIVGTMLMALARPGGVAAQEPQGRIEERLALDNDVVRVILLTFEPGSASGRHVGLEPELGIVVEGELTLVTDAGREVLRPGTARWLPALTPHDARNESDRPLRLWVVLCKKCD